MNNNGATPNKSRIWIFIGLGVLALLVVFAVIKARSKPKGELITAEKVEKRTLREMVSASGKIFPETEVKISSDVSGEIVELYVEEGDTVKAGQILAKIRPDEYQSAVEQGEAALNSARSQRDISSSNAKSSEAQLEQLRADRARAASQLEVARNSHARNERLRKDGVISESEFETSLNSLRAAESALAAADAIIRSSENSLKSAKENINVSGFGINSANARLKELRTSLQKTILVAPMNGIISKLNVEKGERVVGTLQMTGTEVMRIADLSRMEVQVEVSENDILKVKLGDDADIEVDAYLGRKFKGKVTEIGNSASNVGATAAAAALNTDQVTNFIVKIRMDAASYADLLGANKRFPFRPGMSAAVDIYTQVAEGVISVPIISVTAKDNKPEEKAGDKKDEEDNVPSNKQKEDSKPVEIKEVVFVVSGDTVGVREVKTGIQDNDFIEIKEGLQEGDVVVTGPYSAIARKLKGGTKIQLDEKKKAKEKE